MKPWLKLERLDGLLLATFYVVVGALQVGVMMLSNFPPHVGMLAVFSLITAYGLLRARSWSVWFVIGLFFPQLVFGISTLNASMLLYLRYPEPALLLINAALVLFLALSFVSVVYVAAKRKSMQ